ncbi:MAG: hypothetical protein IJR26_11690, partial [Bacteroidales bacterium]|nr:hypothetical protein [Bacteroidales bacterium]
ALAKLGSFASYPKESFAFCEGVTLLAKLGSFAVGGRDSNPDQCNDTPPRRIGEAGKLRLLQSGFLSRPMQRHPTTSHWRSWEASPPIFIGEAGKPRLLSLLAKLGSFASYPKESFAFCEGITFSEASLRKMRIIIHELYVLYDYKLIRIIRIISPYNAKHQNFFYLIINILI